MTALIKLTIRPENITVSVPHGTIIKDAIIMAGIEMDFPCGGEGTCKKCKIDIIEPAFSSRLACQTKLEQDSVIAIPAALHIDRKKLLATIRNHKYQLNPAVKKPNPNHGLALDIGTTGIAGLLVDLNTGKDLASFSASNSQSVFGADVVSRINYAIGHKNGLIDLQYKVIETANEVIKNLCAEAKTEPENISDITVVGNTVMQHLLLGRDVRSLSVMPFEPSYQGAVNIEARKLRFDANHRAQAYIFPHIAGFVGGDAVAVILAMGMHHARQIYLALDIGTNGEIILGSSNGLLCTSAAAGPAFEGIRIASGMRASAGAIESLRITDEGVIYKTIGNKPVAGICGSGLIDALAELVRAKIIDETGKMIAPLPADFPTNITQSDIRELQLAKGAVFAGIKILQKQSGVADKDIEHLYIAGTFGNYIDKHNARLIGLIPDIPMEKVIFTGNAALEGARLALISQEARKEAEQIAQKAKFVNLSADPDFQDAFADAMGF